MTKRNPLWSLLAVAGLLCGVATSAEAQQDRSYRGETSQSSLELPGSQSVISIDADVPSEMRVGDKVDYQVQIRNVSDNVAVHNLKLKVQPQDGLTLEQVKLQKQESQKQSKQNQKSGKQQKSRSNAKKSDKQQNSQTKQQASQSQGKSKKSSDGSHMVTINALMPGESRTITVSATAEKEGQAKACVMVTEFAPALCLTAKAVKPELEIVKKAPKKAGLCEPIEFEYFVKNAGSGDLAAFEVTDKLPKGLQTESGDDHLKFTVDGLDAGETRKFVASLQATQGGEFSSRAVAKTKDGNTTRSSKTTTKVEQARLAVAIDGPQSTLVGQPVSYQIRVTNQGNVAAENAMLSLNYPNAARFRGAGELRESDNAVKANSGNSQPTEAKADDQKQSKNSDQAKNNKNKNQKNQRGNSKNRNSREWELGSLEPGQTKQVSVTLTPTEAKQIRTEAIADYICSINDKDRLQSQAVTSTEVISVPALLVTVIDNEQQRDSLGRVTYTIAVRNQGTAADENIELSAKLPAGLKFVEGSGETKVSSNGQTLKIEPLKELGPDEEARWQIQAEANTDQQKQVRFRVNLTSKSLDQQIVAEEPTTVLPPTSQASTESESKSK